MLIAEVHRSSRSPRFLLPAAARMRAAALIGAATALAAPSVRASGGCAHPTYAATAYPKPSARRMRSAATTGALSRPRLRAPRSAAATNVASTTPSMSRPSRVGAVRRASGPSSASVANPIAQSGSDELSATAGTSHARSSVAASAGPGCSGGRLASRASRDASRASPPSRPNLPARVGVDGGTAPRPAPRVRARRPHRSRPRSARAVRAPDVRAASGRHDAATRAGIVRARSAGSVPREACAALLASTPRPR